MHGCRLPGLLAAVALATAAGPPTAGAVLVPVDQFHVRADQPQAHRSVVLARSTAYTIMVSGETISPSNACDGVICTRSFGRHDALYCYASYFAADQYNNPCGKGDAPPVRGAAGLIVAVGREGNTRPVPPDGIDVLSGDGRGSIPFRPDHRYEASFKTHDVKDPQRLIAASQCSGCTGGFDVRILKEGRERRIRFSFSNDVVVGVARTRSSGRGAFAATKVPGERGDWEGEPEEPFVFRHVDEYIVSDDDRLELESVGTITYRFTPTKKAVYEAVSMDVVVAQSDDSDCPEGRKGELALLEAKGGRGKVVLRLDCEGHTRHVVTERRTGDRVTVKISGPGPRG